MQFNLTCTCLEATKSMCKLAGNDPATVSDRRPGDAGSNGIKEVCDGNYI